jgi:putative aldouronate transport system permease protein
MARRLGASDVAFHSLNGLLMLTALLVTAYPFYYILVYSLSNAQLVTAGPMLWPKGFSLTSYVVTLKTSRVLHAMLVSVLRASIGPVLSVFFTSMTAYVLTQRQLVFRKFFLRFFVFTMYFSSGIIPLYLWYKMLHLTGSFFVYILPALINVYNVIVVKTFMESLPPSLEESGLIDGASEWAIFTRIVLPLCKPAIATILLFECVNQWNAFWDTLIFNSMDSNLHTLQYVLYNFITSRINSLEQLKSNFGVTATLVTPMSLRMAVMVITILPIALIYPLLQKQFAKGLLLGAVKG